MMAAQAGAPPAAQPVRAGLYLALATPTLIGEAFRLVHTLRRQGMDAIMDYDGKSLKAQLREADKLSFRYVAIFGEEELRQQMLTVKDLAQGQGQQQQIPLNRVKETLAPHA